jgi:hypothetical protein
VASGAPLTAYSCGGSSGSRDDTRDRIPFLIAVLRTVEQLHIGLERGRLSICSVAAHDAIPQLAVGRSSTTAV